MKIDETARLSQAVQKLFSKNQIKQKETVLDLGEKSMRIKMFRSDDLKNKIKESDLEALCRSFALNIEPEIEKLMHLLLSLKILMRLQREDEGLIGEKLKWPKKMRLSLNQQAEKSKVQFFSFVTTEKSKSWIAYLIVTLILLVFLYPIWPFPLRVMVFYLCFYLMVTFIIFQIIRFIIYFLFRICGHEFWILPNINENNMSIKPFYTFQRCSDEILGIFLRISFFLISILFIVYIYLSSQVREDIVYFVQKSHDDALEYGLDKIKFNYTDSTKRGVSYENIIKELEENDTSSSTGNSSSME